MSDNPTPSETAVALFTPNEAALREAVESAVRSRANLAGANIAGADLARAYRAGAATGSLRGYGWACLRHADGPRLRYGCEEHALADWTPALIANLCAQHTPHDAAMPAALTALAAFCREVVQ